MSNFRGDTGLIRDALEYAGVMTAAGEPLSLRAMIFNDKNKRSRRLKIWNAGALIDSTDEVKSRFMRRLSSNFGNRITRVTLPKKNSWSGMRSFAVHLKRGSTSTTSRLTRS